MASGSEHYRSAEAILREIEENGKELSPLEIELRLRAASVYARLAHVAATAIKIQTPEEANSWRRACGVRKD